MNQSNPLDTLFNEGLGDFKSTPSDGLWTRLSQEMDSLAEGAHVVDQTFEKGLNNLKGQPNAQSWNVIEHQLDALLLAKQQQFNRMVWAGLAASIVLLISFIGLNQPWNYDLKEQKTASHLESPQKSITVPFIKSETPVLKVDRNEPTQNQGVETVSNSLPILNNEEPSEQSEIVVASNINNLNFAKEAIVPCAEAIPTIMAELAAKPSYEEEPQHLILPQDILNAQLETETAALAVPQQQPLSAERYRRSQKQHFEFEIFAGPAIGIAQNQSWVTFYENNRALVQEMNQKLHLEWGANFKYVFGITFVQSGVSTGNFSLTDRCISVDEKHDFSNGYYTYSINTYYTYDTIGWVDDPLQPGMLVPLLQSNLNVDTLSSQWTSIDSLYYLTQEQKFQNSSRYIEIPLMVGYQITKGRWGLGMAAGASYGFVVKSHSQLENPSQTYNTDTYQSHQFNALVSLQLQYAITSQFSLILQPTYKFNIKSLTENSLQSNILSFRAGFNYKI